MPKARAPVLPGRRTSGLLRAGRAKTRNFTQKMKLLQPFSGSKLYRARLFDQLAHPPRLGFREQPALFDQHHVALFELVVLVVSVVFLGARDDFAVERVLHAPLDEHRHGFLHLVADHAPGQRALVAAGFSHDWRAFSLSNVRTRAMSRRTFLIWLLLVSCCVATCMRRLNCALSNSFSSCWRSAGSFALNSLAFTP